MSSGSLSAVAIPLARGPLVGTFLGLILYGVTCVQAFFYYRTYERDGWRLKSTVALLVVFETAHAALTMWVMDDYLIANYADVATLDSATLPYVATYTLGLFIDFYVYMYFTWRIWLFTKSGWVVVLMTAISVSRTAISITATILSTSKPTLSNYLSDPRTQTLLLVGNTLFIVGDTFSAGAMAYHLSQFKVWAHALPRTRTRPRPRRIDIVLNRLLIFAVATGALTSFVDVMALILTVAQPTSLAFLSTILIQTRLYANSLLASLNIRNAAASPYDDTTHPSQAVELPAISLRFARPSDVSTMSEMEAGTGTGVETPVGDGGTDVRLGHSTSKPDMEPLQMTYASSRTLPMV